MTKLQAAMAQGMYVASVSQAAERGHSPSIAWAQLWKLKWFVSELQEIQHRIANMWSNS